MLPKEKYKALKRKCIAKYEWAKRNGKIDPIEGKKCVDCGKPATCYDHRSYYKPLEVEPVCKKCNSKRGQAYPYCSGWKQRRAGLEDEEGYEDLGYSESSIGIDFDFKAHDDHIDYLFYCIPDRDYDGLSELGFKKRDGKYVQSEYRVMYFNGQVRVIKK